MSLTESFKRAANNIVTLCGFKSTDGTLEELHSTNNALDVNLSTRIAGEDQSNDVIKVEHQNGSASATRTTTAVTLGTTGAAGDYLERVILTSAVTTATLTVSDKNGTVLASFLTTDPVGTVREVGAVASGAGFQVDLHASGVGTVTAIGRFT